MAITLRDLHKEGFNILKANASITTAELDSRILLQHALQLRHEDLLLKKDHLIDQKYANNYIDLIKRRNNNEPIAYITGSKEFYGYHFRVNKNTLIPRPDTEILVEKACQLFPKNQNIKILDIGTGSGCIAISLAKYYINAHITATDKNIGALEMAGINADNLGVSIDFQHNKNFASNIAEKFDLIVSNPPYIETKIIETLQKDVKDFEPMMALDGGDDGLNPYRIIAEQACSMINNQGYILVEIGINQQNAITDIFEANGFNKVAECKDLSSIVRCLLFAK